jgi:hypothetical protein
VAEIILDQGRIGVVGKALGLRALVIVDDDAVAIGMIIAPTLLIAVAEIVADEAAKAGRRRIAADIAALIDGEAAGVPLIGGAVGDLRKPPL